jgi:membrane-bound lytic murein transglycosylase D
MTKTFLFVAFVFYVPVLFGQTYHTPSKIMFADMELRLSEALRKEIQVEVDALSRNPKYLNIKLDRAMLYFPLIERIFKEENLPEDFKYLVIQESALIPDAVSTSNAVGFWQFKKEAAEEVGLRLDGGVDERMNIVSSTRGAARYLKKHNLFFDNWIYALLAYYAGRGGAEKLVDKKNYGSRTMHLDRNLHWYLKKFLAHKVVFENALKDYPAPDIFLFEYSLAANKSLKEVARDFSVNELDVYEYNKWLRREKAPLDKQYTVIIPLKASSSSVIASTVASQQEITKPRHAPNYVEDSPKYPEIEEFQSFDAYHVKINGKQGVFARNETDNISSLALIGNVPVERFRKLNDLSPSDEIKVGHVYYLQPKNNKAKTHYHVLQPDEDLWIVSQKYGLKLNKLRQKNRITKNEEVKPGTLLWLRFIRPRNHPVEYKPVQVARHQNTAVAPLETSPSVAPTVVKTPTPVVKPTVEVKNVEVKEVNEVKEVEVVKEIKEPAIKQEATPVNNEVIPASVNTQLPSTHSVATLEKPKENINSQNNIHNDGTHIVKQGETIYSISRHYELPITQLMALNNLTYEGGIKIGQVLIVKKANADSKTGHQIEQSTIKTYIYHKVSAGETLYRIARQYNVTIQELMEWNNKTDFNVSIGENLRVSK